MVLIIGDKTEILFVFKAVSRNYLRISIKMEVHLEASISAPIFLIKFSGLWTYKTNTVQTKFYKIYKLFVFTSMIFFNAIQIVQFYQTKPKLEEIAAKSYYYVCTSTVLFKMIAFNHNFEATKQALQFLTNREHKAFSVFQSKAKEEQQILTRGIYFSKQIFYVQFLSATSCVITYFLFPVVGYVTNCKMVDSLNECGGKYHLENLWAKICIIFTATAAIGIDDLFLVLMVQITTQCELISKKLQNLNKDSSFEIKSIITHHKTVLM